VFILILFAVHQRPQRIIATQTCWKSYALNVGRYLIIFYASKLIDKDERNNRN